MTLAALFALLVHLGVCTPVHFKAPHRAITVLVCGYADRKVPPPAPPRPLWPHF